MVKVMVLFLSIVMWNEKRFGREMVQNEPLVKNLTIFSRNTIPLYDIILYYIIYLCTHKKAICAKCTKSASDFVQNTKNLKKSKKIKKKGLQFAKKCL